MFKKYDDISLPSIKWLNEIELSTMTRLQHIFIQSEFEQVWSKLWYLKK